MSGTRIVLLSLLFVGIIAGHVYDIAYAEEHWPFSNYPMYSWHTGGFVRRAMLVGVGREREVPLEIDEHLHPFDHTRLQGALGHIRRHGRQPFNRALQKLLQRYETLRERGAHAGPPLVALRSYDVGWKIRSGATNRHDPNFRRLKYSALYVPAAMEERLRAEAREDARTWGSRKDWHEVPNADVVLDAGEPASLKGLQIIDDRLAASGRALHIDGPSWKRPPDEPSHHADYAFRASPGRYTIWLRGTSEAGMNGDSCWVQLDEEIGTRKGRRHRYGLGNWHDQLPPGAYAWSSTAPGRPAAEVELEEGGTHRLRITARQTPFRLDQIWLSRTRRHPPSFVVPVRKKGGASE